MRIFLHLRSWAMLAWDSITIGPRQAWDLYLLASQVGRLASQRGRAIITGTEHANTSWSAAEWEEYHAGWGSQPYCWEHAVAVMTDPNGGWDCAACQDREEQSWIS